MAILKAIVWCSVILACCALGACVGSDQSTVWSTKATSPNGEITAHAYAVKGGGFGNAYAFTGVDIAGHGNSLPVRVVTFNNVCAYSERTGIVTLQWVSNSRLIVTHTRCSETPELTAKAMGVSVTIATK